MSSVEGYLWFQRRTPLGHCQPGWWCHTVTVVTTWAQNCWMRAAQGPWVSMWGLCTIVYMLKYVCETLAKMRSKCLSRETAKHTFLLPWAQTHSWTTLPQHWEFSYKGLNVHFVPANNSKISSLIHTALQILTAPTSQYVLQKKNQPNKHKHNDNRRVTWVYICHCKKKTVADKTPDLSSSSNTNVIHLWSSGWCVLTMWQY